jgi:hypothetical protein
VEESGVGGRIDPRDAAAIARITGMVRAFRNTTSWYNNASFLLPLLATVIVGIAFLITRRAELFGFALFLAVVTLAMLPVVLAAWRQTATTVVVAADTLVSLHGGRVLKSLPWASVIEIGERETQGNIRWEIRAADGSRVLLDGELDDLDELVRLARQLAGLNRC